MTGRWVLVFLASAVGMFSIGVGAGRLLARIETARKIALLLAELERAGVFLTANGRRFSAKRATAELRKYTCKSWRCEAHR